MSNVERLAEALLDQGNEDEFDDEGWVENAQDREGLGGDDAHVGLPVLQLVEGQVLHHFFKVLRELTDEAGDVEIGVCLV